MSSPLSLFRLIRETSPERHAKATAGLQDGSLTVTITTHTDHEIRAIVCSGEQRYGVHVSEHGAACGCADFAWRNITCKHALAALIYFLQPKPEPVIEKIHLQWQSGQLLCEEPHPLRVWTWPWPMSILAHPAQWPEISLCRPCLATWQHPQLKEAA